MTAQVPELLAAAGVPAQALTQRRRRLPMPVQRLHRQVLLHIASTGGAPGSADLAGWARELGVDAPAALGALAGAELVFLDSGAGVLGGVPFAPGVTAHQVRVAGGPTVSANCAVDALGIAAMLDTDIDIASLDPHTGEAITATSRDGQWSWQPKEAVVFLGAQGEGRLTDACCPVINFFASDTNARAYQQQHSLTGIALPLPEAAQVGALVFGELLREPVPPRPPTTDDASVGNAS